MERDRWGIQVRIRFGDYHLRMGGMLDMLFYAQGASVLDVGCNRGLISYLFAQAGARLVHGCDYYEPAIEVCRQWFADLKEVQSQFEVCDLSQGPASLSKFGNGQYDIILLSAVIHKIRRQMPVDLLRDLLRHFGNVSTKYIAARVVDEDRDLLEEAIASTHIRVHWSILDEQLGQCLIWRRRH